MIKQILLDSRCIICGSKKLSAEFKYICDDCLAAFDHEQTDLCPICGHPLIEGQCPSHSHLGEIFFDDFKFVQTYTGFFKNVVYKLKKHDEFMINRLLVDILLRKNLIDKNIPVTVVPDLSYRAFRRGRASMYYVLKLLKKSGFKTIKDIYKKTFHFIGKKQKTKTRQQRLNQIGLSYHIPPENVGAFQGEIYLIDDVYTTGATLNYGARLLKEAGFSKVHGIAFFRTILEQD